MLTVPNLLSCVRFLLLPLLLALAWLGHTRLLLLTLVISLLTDILDGRLARLLNQRTELGAKLDSWADVATWLTLPLCAWWLRPEVLRQESPWLVGGIGFFLASVLFGFIKYRRLISYHTWGAKVLAGVVGVTVLAFFAGAPGWVLRIAMPLVALSAIEEMLITAALPEWRANVPSLWHALKLRRQQTTVTRS